MGGGRRQLLASERKDERNKEGNEKGVWIDHGEKGGDRIEEVEEWGDSGEKRKVGGQGNGNRDREDGLNRNGRRGRKEAK